MGYPEEPQEPRVRFEPDPAWIGKHCVVWSKNAKFVPDNHVVLDLGLLPLEKAPVLLGIGGDQPYVIVFKKEQALKAIQLVLQAAQPQEDKP